MLEYEKQTIQNEICYFLYSYDERFTDSVFSGEQSAACCADLLLAGKGKLDGLAADFFILVLKVKVILKCNRKLLHCRFWPLYLFPNIEENVKVWGVYVCGGGGRRVGLVVR